MTVRQRDAAPTRDTEAPPALVLRAREYAQAKHRGATGRDGSVPYFDHVAEVAGHVYAAGAPYPVVAAAYLHDVVEHAEGSIAEIRALFGPAVAGTVEHVTNATTDPGTGRKLSWHEQKKHAIAAVDPGDRGVTWLKSADLLSNASELLRNFARYGDTVWRQYEGSPSEQVGYYLRLGERLLQRLDSRYLRRELDATMRALRKLAAEQGITPDFATT
jgi:(p)ppGpp synthase/HD superfamily hydrolase